MSLLGTRKYVDLSFEALTAKCAAQSRKSRIVRNNQGALSLTHQLADGTLGPGQHVMCSELTEADLPRAHEAWYSQAEIGVAEAGWDAPKPWRESKAQGPLQTQTPDPSGFGG